MDFLFAFTLLITDILLLMFCITNVLVTYKNKKDLPRKTSLKVPPSSSLTIPFNGGKRYYFFSNTSSN